jgi:hypothetical protein
MHEKTFEIEYIDLREDESHDVSFELSEDAEELLFRGIADKLYDGASEGYFDGQVVHLYKRLSDQRLSHPPWIDIDGPRVYDLELTESEYGILSSIIASNLSTVIGPDKAEDHRELVRVWDDITEQMIEDDEQDHENAVLDDFTGGFEPDIGDFIGYKVDDMDIARFRDDDGDEWYRCTRCRVTRPGTGDHHDCDE